MNSVLADVTEHLNVDPLSLAASLGPGLAEQDHREEEEETSQHVVSSRAGQIGLRTELSLSCH